MSLTPPCPFQNLFPPVLCPHCRQVSPAQTPAVPRDRAWLILESYFLTTHCKLVTSPAKISPLPLHKRSGSSGLQISSAHTLLGFTFHPHKGQLTSHNKRVGVHLQV